MAVKKVDIGLEKKEFQKALSSRHFCCCWRAILYVEDEFSSSERSAASSENGLRLVACESVSVVAVVGLSTAIASTVARNLAIALCRIPASSSRSRAYERTNVSEDAQNDEEGQRNLP